MSGTRIATIICWSISALVLIGLVIWFFVSVLFGGGGFLADINLFGINITGTDNITGPFEMRSEYTSTDSNINTINVHWVAGEITVTPHEGNQIIVLEYAQRELKDNEQMHVSTSGAALTVRFRERSNLSGRMPRKDLEIRVPKELSESMAMLNINTTSGTISIDSINATTIDLSSVSGNLNISDSASTALNFNTTSGRANAAGNFDKVDISTVSGSVTVRSTVAPSRIKISTVSGATDIYLPNDGEISVSHSAVSGRFSSEIPVTMQSGAPYSFSSVSGNTNIHVLG